MWVGVGLKTHIDLLLGSEVLLSHNMEREST